MTTCSFEINEKDVKPSVRAEFSGFVCDRESWKHKQCVLHDDSRGKPANAIIDAISEGSLIGVKLYDVDIPQDLDLANRDLFRADIRGCKLEKVNLSESRLIDAQISDTNLRQADLNQTSFANSDIDSTYFNGAELTGAVFNEASLENVDFRNASMENTKFGAVDLSGIRLPGINFSGAHFEGANLSGCILTGTNFEDAVLTGTDLRNADFGGANLRGVDFRGAKVENTHFGGADLSKSCFYNIDLSSTGLGGSKFEEVDFRLSNLSTLDLSGLDFEGTDFRGAKISGVNFRGANLSSCNLEGTVLEDLDLRNANLVDARLHQTHFRNIRIDRSTDLGGKCHYETLEDNYEKAVSVYRDLQQLSRENSITEQVRNFRIREKDAQLRIKDSMWSVFIGKLSRSVWLYGESWRRLLATSFSLIVIYALAYYSSNLEVVHTIPSEISFINQNFGVPAIVANIITSLYFSIVTFSTLGYGDVQPTSLTIQMLAASEALIGTLLMAALVFVLGRRATW